MGSQGLETGGVAKSWCPQMENEPSGECVTMSVGKSKGEVQSQSDQRSGAEVQGRGRARTGNGDIRKDWSQTEYSFRLHAFQQISKLSGIICSYQRAVWWFQGLVLWDRAPCPCASIGPPCQSLGVSPAWGSNGLVPVLGEPWPT